MKISNLSPYYRKLPGALLMLLAFSVCSNGHLRDSSIPAKWLKTVEADIEKNPNDPEGYFYRARVYSNNCQKNPRKFLEYCIGDATKAIELGGKDKAPFQYYALRGYCHGALVLGCEWDMPPQPTLNFEQDNDVVRSDEQMKSLEDADLDFASAIARPPAKNIPSPEFRNEGYFTTVEANAMLNLHQRKFRAAKTSYDFLLRHGAGVQAHRLFHVDDFHRDGYGQHYALIVKTEAAVLRQARQQKAPNLAEFEASYAEAKTRLEKHQQERESRAKESARVEAWAKDNAERERVAEKKRQAERREAACQAETGKPCPTEHTCGNCRGTGQVTSYEIGKARECYTETSPAGLKRTTCTPGAEGGHRTGICPVCKGRGVVLQP